MRTTFWIFFHFQITSLETSYDVIYFENPFGFQDDEANWLVIDNTIAMLSTLILIKKHLRFLRYLHLNTFSGSYLKYDEFILLEILWPICTLICFLTNSTCLHVLQEAMS